MCDVFRIQDRFKITGRGTVYTIEKSRKALIKLGDVLFDLKGNRFKVKGFEMCIRIPEGKHIEDMPVGLMFELMDDVEAAGNIFVSELQDINFLFCNHPLYQRKVDEDYKEEYQAAGLKHPCALFSYEDLESGKLSLFGEPISGLTIYRGWMMKPEMYDIFYALLEKQGIILINTPAEYRKYHLLPEWYGDYEPDTTFSIWESKGKSEDAMKMSRGLTESYIVKDYGKSGMPLSEEYRVFIFAGTVLAIDDYRTDHSEIRLSEHEKEWINKIAQSVKSNFVTVDIARKTNGELVIMEFDDGQVSELQQIEAARFYDSFSEDEKVTIPDDAYVMINDPMPDVSIEEMSSFVEQINSTQGLVDAYVMVHNKFWYIEDDLYDYEEDSEEYKSAEIVVEKWAEFMHLLDKRIMEKAEDEKLLDDRLPDSGTIKQLERFMDKYGYKNGHGWWVN